MSSIKSVTPANQVFLVMGLEKNSSDATQNGYVIFAGVVAKDQATAGGLFLSKNPNFELMSVSALSEMQDADILKDEHASLAKVFCSLRTRDIVAQAREVMGGNGILLEHDVARFVADSEAIYSYEGTKEINSLIVGRSITGFSAFV